MQDITSLTVGHYGMMYVMPVFAALAVLCYVLVPKQYKETVEEKVLIIVFHVLGLVALSGLTWWMCDIPDSSLKWALTIFQTFYLDLLLASNLILVLIKLAAFLWKKFKLKVPRKINYKVLWLLTLCFTGFLAFVSIYHDVSVQNTSYTVDNNNKQTPAQEMKIAMYADSHIGAGANVLSLGYATDNIITMNPDLFILDGDIVDGTTGQNELDYLNKTLKNINPKYGKYFVMGNHDDNCLYDFEGALRDAGVIILKDEAVRLPNGAILVGKDDSTDIDASEIMSNCGISEAEQKSSYIVLAQHRPQRAELYQTQVDLMLCGHTHGNHFPKVNPLSIFSDKLVYGMRYYDNMCAITTSGLSSWGFHTKWPSFSEIIEVNIGH